MAWGQGDGVRLHAAGSLRAALTEVARDFTAASGVRVDLVFGASGLLRERLERGEPGDVFASANMEQPEPLARVGKAGPAVLFARNRLCALARPEVRVTEDTLLDRMLDRRHPGDVHAARRSLG
jgi:molybdate transport system substrate-binding protein